MAFFQQNEPVLVDVARRHPCIRRTRIARRDREQKRIVEQHHLLDIALAHRKRQQYGIERAAHQFVHQHAGLRLAQFDTQLRIALLQHRQHARQDVRRQRRDHAELQSAGERPRAVAGEIGEVTRRRQHGLGALRDFNSGFRQHHIVRPPLDQFDTKVPLQFADLHRQRRLGHGAGLGGLAKVPMRRQRGQISQLFQGDHADKII